MIEVKFKDGSKLWKSTYNCFGYLGNNESIAKKEFWINIKNRDYLNEKYFSHDFMIECC